MQLQLEDYKGYQAKITYSEADNIWVGEIIGIQDSLNFHGRTMCELDKMFHQSVDNYLYMCPHFKKKPEIPMK